MLKIRDFSFRMRILRQNLDKDTTINCPSQGPGVAVLSHGDYLGSAATPSQGRGAAAQFFNDVAP